MHRRFFLLLLLLPLFLPAAGCSLFWPDRDTRPVADARARWEALGWDDYTYRFRWNCFCAPPFTSPVDLVVRGGALVSGSLVDSSRALTDDELADWRTIDGLFDLIDEARARDAREIRADYHDTYGYPREVWIDYEANVADEELGFEVQNVRPLR